MTTHRSIASSEWQPKAPVTSELIQALAQNYIATAEGASGSPTMEVAWHELETVTLGSDGGAVVFTTDISAYRAIRVRGGSKRIGSGGTLSLDLTISASWRTAVSHTLTNNAVIFDAECDNIDAAGDAFRKVAKMVVADFNILSGDWYSGSASYTAATAIGFSHYATAATAVRISSSQDFDVSAGGTSFTLFGIKRTQP